MADLHAAWLGMLNEKHGTNVKHEDVTDWGIHKFFPGLSRNEVYSPLRDPEIYARTQPSVGALWGIKSLRTFTRVVFVSSCVIGSTDTKMRWLVKHGFLPKNQSTPSDFVAAYDKAMVRGSLLIDDAPHNVESYPGPTVLIDAPYNRTVSHPRRVTSWEGVVAEVGRILQ